MKISQFKAGQGKVQPLDALDGAVEIAVFDGVLRGVKVSRIATLTAMIALIAWHTLLFVSSMSPRKALPLIASLRRTSGGPVTQFDMQIAAIAQARGAALETRNTADFDHCGIIVLNPWSDQ